MKLLVQPQDGVADLVRSIDSAKKSVEIAIFRFDRSEIEQALRKAVARGVFVHALIARTNRGGEQNLRKLENRLLEYGVTVARTADDLLRHHNKMLIIDRQTLYLLAFNFTYLDIARSRSFGIVTEDRRFVQEAIKLFEADVKRQTYIPGIPSFLVSPANARQGLAKFIRGSRKELLIYDPRISDRSMIKLLEDRNRAGIDVRIIGRVARPSAKLCSHKLAQMRLHSRTIIRDGHQAFIGSQSLRQVELDERREAGIIIRDPGVVTRLVKIFEDDWNSALQHSAEESMPVPVEKTVKKVAKAVAKELPPIAPVVQHAVEEVVGNGTSVELDTDEIEETLKDAVKEAVKEIVKDVVEEADDSTSS